VLIEYSLQFGSYVGGVTMFNVAALQLVHMLERSDIEHRDSTDIASELKRVFDQHCDASA